MKAYKKISKVLLALTSLTIVLGCATNRTIPAKIITRQIVLSENTDQVWQAALFVLNEQGWSMRKADKTSRVLVTHKRQTHLKGLFGNKRKYGIHLWGEPEKIRQEITTLRISIQKKKSAVTIRCKSHIEEIFVNPSDGKTVATSNGTLEEEFFIALKLKLAIRK